MKKSKILIICFACILLAFSVCAPFTSLAVSTDKAQSPIDTSRQCNLQITCRDTKGNAAPNLQIKLYHIATVSQELEFTLTEKLSACAIDINGIQSTDEWNSIMQTADAYITAKKISPDYTLTTDTSGAAVQKQLAQGIYYAVITDPAGAVFIQPCMLSLPTLSDDGVWLYDVLSYPKPYIPEELKQHLKVVKQWKDDKDAKRPDSVTVDIYRDGEYFETATLNTANGWCYNKTSDQAHLWTAVEKDVPDGYVVRIEKTGDTIIITNSINTPTPLPKTGDRGITPFVIAFAVSGVALILLGVIFKKDKNEQN